MLLPNPNKDLFPEEAGLGSIPQVSEKSRHVKTGLNSLTLIAAHKVDSECLGPDGYRWLITRSRPYRLVGRLSPEDLGRSNMCNLFWLTFVPPLVPLRYRLVPTLPQWYVSFRLSSLYLLTDPFEVLIDCVVVDTFSPNQSKISVPS